MLSDVRYAKESIRQRLGAAKALEAFAAEILESASDKLDKAHSDVRAAEAMMKEAEEKWPEIEIDDDTSTVIPPSKKRKKIVAFPYTGGLAVDWGIDTAPTAGQPSHGTRDDGAVRSTASTPARRVVQASSFRGVVAASTAAPSFADRSSRGVATAATAVQPSHGTHGYGAVSRQQARGIRVCRRVQAATAVQSSATTVV